MIAAEPISDVDTTAADMLEVLDEALNARGISLAFAEMSEIVQDVLLFRLARNKGGAWGILLSLIHI